jgi:uncharacterized metal-binding protein YceD (DUF177 family)
MTSASDGTSNALRVADLSGARPTAFDIRPGAAELQRIAAELDLLDLRKLSFAGQVQAEGKSGWRLTGRLGATVVQPCSVTLAPVTTRIDEDVLRRFLPEEVDSLPDEMEMPEDETADPLGSHIDPGAIMQEALALALPLYPRAEGADPGDAVYTEPGKAALTDEDLRPFAALKSLKSRLEGDD